MIEELPIEEWTEHYKTFLDSLVVDDVKNIKKGQILKDYTDDCGNNTIKFTLTFLEGVLQNLLKRNEIEKKLKLINKHSTSNMHLHDLNNDMRKYNSANEILLDYCNFRLKLYEDRKEYYLKLLENKLTVLGYKIKFLNDVINSKIVVVDFENKKTKSKEFVIKQLIDSKYPKLSNDINSCEEDKSYDYLTNITIFSLTDEERNRLMDEHKKKLEEFTVYKNTLTRDIWLNEINEFEKGYLKWLQNQSPESETRNTKKKRAKK
jgi:DNA topoisomerase-2